MIVLILSVVLSLAPLGVGAGWACTMRADRNKKAVVIRMAGRATGAWQQQGSVVEFGADWVRNPHKILPKGHSTISVHFKVPFTSEYVINMQTEARHQT